MAQFLQARGQALTGLQSWAQNPLQNAFFNTLAQMQRANVGQQGQSAMQSLLQGARTSGFNTSSPYMQSLMAQQGRAQSGQQAQGFNALLSQMPQYQLQALGALQGGFGPLQTGGTQQQSYTGTQSGRQTGQQTQQMSGLGTWLPQLAGGLLGAASGFMGGGGPLLSRGGGSMNFGGMPSPTSSMGGIGSLQVPNIGDMPSSLSNFQMPMLMGQPGMPSGFGGFSSPGGG